MDFYGIGTAALRKLDAEHAHRMGLKFLQAGVHPRYSSPENLRVKRFGRWYNNPVGIAAGFDKNAEVFDAMLKMGFGFSEVGTVTPKAQAGNSKPRVFRLKSTMGVINRLGFPGDGEVRVRARLANRNPSSGPLWINIGKNKMTEAALDDYLYLSSRLAAFADALVVNVSSPNTPGLRDLQSPTKIKTLVSKVAQELEGVPLLVKLAPDWDREATLLATVDACCEAGAQGLILGNTTVSRSGIEGLKYSDENGGLSGAPLFEHATKVLSAVYRHTQGVLPLIGVGGICSGEQAYEKIKAGACCVQFYTGMIYRGPVLLRECLDAISKGLQRDGFKTVDDAVGASR